MTLSIDRGLCHNLRKEAHPMTGDSSDFDSLLALVGDSRFVLIGEASHGTHEFYRIRAEITKRLIREKGFSANQRSERRAAAPAVRSREPGKPAGKFRDLPTPAMA